MHQRLQYLLKKHLSSSLTEAEWLEMNELLKSVDPQIQVNLLKDSITSFKADNTTDPAVLDRIAEAVLGSDRPSRPVRHMSLAKKHWMKAAAAVLVLSCGLALFQFNRRSTQQPVAREQNLEKSVDIPAGSNKAFLTLADGSTIILDSATNGTLAIQGSTNIIKDGQRILYTPGERIAGKDQYALNTMSTPRGGQYTLTLPDGSQAWLNAASSITYPTWFGDGPRKVTVTGEVFLDIKKDPSRPFYVGVNTTEIQVLGTSFNINSYLTEDEQLTTLLDGSVKMISGIDSLVLRAGQQGVVDKKGKLSKKTEVNTEEVVAWKNGFFSFDHADIRSVMRQLERWYDIDVIYAGNPPAKIIQGKMERKLSLAQVLGILNKMEIHSQLTGRKLTIMQ